MAASSPTVLKRHVALQLRQLRETVGLKRDEVAQQLGRTVGHVRHLETMVSLPNQLEVKALLPLYGAPDRVEPFLALVRAAKSGKDWWTDFPGVPSWLELMLGMEQAAVTINSYDTMVIPGLFQTPGYAHAVIRGGEPNLPDDVVNQRVELRMARQDVLNRPEPPQVWCLLDEPVLLRRADDPAVLREQLEHLVKISDLPNVHLQVLTQETVGLHCGVDGTFTVLTFGPELVGDPGVAYTETLISGTYHESAAEIMRYRDTWSRLQLLAQSPDQSRAILARRAQEITT